jgi:hypothetical protein
MSMTTSLRERLTAPTGTRPHATYRQDLVTVLLSLWIMVGLMLDAWAHNNVPELESFFTPWHGVFYSGFVVTAGWIMWMVWRNRPAGGAGRLGMAAVPVGYGPAIVGLPLFAAAGIGDFIWHQVYGIEQDLKILFSPTHVLLVTSMILIFSAPLLSVQADRTLPARPSVGRLLPAVLSVALSTTIVLLFLQYGNALLWSPWDIWYALSDPLDGSSRPGWPNPVDLASKIAVTNVLILIPLLLLAARRQAPPGTATILYATLAGLAAAITEANAPGTLVALLVAGIALDLLLWRLRPEPERRTAYLVFAGLAPLITWTCYIAAASVQAGGVPRVTEYWTGIPVLAGLIGVLVAVVCLPARPPSAPSET